MLKMVLRTDVRIVLGIICIIAVWKFRYVEIKNIYVDHDIMNIAENLMHINTAYQKQGTAPNTTCPTCKRDYGITFYLKCGQRD